MIVTDGFVGNVSLKTGEGLAALVNHTCLRSEFKRNWLTKLAAAIVALPVLNSRVRRKLDPRRYNGASLLGLNGIVVKSHGSADTSSFKRYQDCQYRDREQMFRNAFRAQSRFISARPRKQ